ncbi:DUF317 domain-containing protein [Streptacidiphilus sp. MAP5-52]|uniref:DUF317 domain-containing protein n=1 Tax=Streptacidiphilus sp. MAP5-52 TaxID=3156267 RepID=UPI0035185267
MAKDIPCVLRDAYDEPYDETVMAPLRAKGWTAVYDTIGQYHLTSPCQRVRLGVMPEEYPELVVQIAASHIALQAPLWHLSFDGNTPQQYIAVVTAELHEALVNDPNFPFTEEADPQVLPHKAGWTSWTGAGNTMLRAPDGFASVIVHRPPHRNEQPQYQAGWAFDGVGGNRWHTTFSHYTPHHIVRAFYEAMTSPLLPQSHKGTVPEQDLSNERDPDIPSRAATAQTRSTLGPAPEHGPVPAAPGATQAPARPRPPHRP